MPLFTMAQLTIGGDYNVSLYNKFTSTKITNNNNINNHVTINTYSFSNRLCYSLNINQKQSVSFGINFSNNQLKHKNIIDSVIIYHYEYGSNPDIIDTTVVYYPISLIENSLRIGIYLDYQYVFQV